MGIRSPRLSQRIRPANRRARDGRRCAPNAGSSSLLEKAEPIRAARWKVGAVSAVDDGRNVNDCRFGVASSERRRHMMRSKVLGLIALLAALALADVGTALADNNASGSIGAVQVGNTSVDPSVNVSLPATSTAASTAVSAPTSVAGSGNNKASNSAGVVQVGGGNTASGSTGAVQSSAVSSSPSVSASAAGSSAHVSAPASVGGSGGNS